MILILEGPNKCGKTTLADFLVRNYRFKYHKNRKWYDIEKAIGVSEQKKYAEGAITAISEMFKFFDKKQNYIIDRHHWTEYAYGLANRGYVSKMFFEVDRFLLDDSFKFNYQVRVLYLTDSVDELTFRNNMNMRYLSNCFDIAYNWSELPRFKANAKNIFEIAQWLELDELEDLFIYNEYADKFNSDRKEIIGDERNDFET